MVSKNRSTRKAHAKTGGHSCTLPATITPDPFATKEQMLNFIARASEGIIARTNDGIAVVIKI